MGSEKKRGTRQRVQRAEAKGELDKRVVTGMSGSLRTQMLVILNERMASVNELAKELGVPPEKVRYELNVLKKAELVRVKAERRVRGTYELFYEATARACIDQVEWPSVPEALKGGLRGSLLDTLTDDAVDAIEGETFDSLEGAHMSWTPVIVDDQGWEELTDVLRHALERVIEVKEASAERLNAKDVKGTSCTVSMLGYPSANEDRMVGPPTDARTLPGSDGQKEQVEKPQQRSRGKAGKGRSTSGTRKLKRKGEGQ